MNWDQIDGKWKQISGRAKEKWGKLTDDDLDIIAGKRDQLVGKVQGMALQRRRPQKRSKNGITPSSWTPLGETATRGQWPSNDLPVADPVG